MVKPLSLSTLTFALYFKRSIIVIQVYEAGHCKEYRL
jgi:hypothetical protein